MNFMTLNQLIIYPLINLNFFIINDIFKKYFNSTGISVFSYFFYILLFFLIFFKTSITFCSNSDNNVYTLLYNTLFISGLYSITLAGVIICYFWFPKPIPDISDLPVYVKGRPYKLFVPKDLSHKLDSLDLWQTFFERLSQTNFTYLHNAQSPGAAPVYIEHLSNIVTEVATEVIKEREVYLPDTQYSEIINTYLILPYKIFKSVFTISIQYWHLPQFIIATTILMFFVLVIAFLFQYFTLENKQFYNNNKSKIVETVNNLDSSISSNIPEYNNFFPNLYNSSYQAFLDLYYYIFNS